MKQDIFEELMLAEWKKNTLEHYKKYADTIYFDQAKDLADCDQLYNFFYPLGISSCGIHDVARVCSSLHYAIKDDGDLSIVLAYQSPPKMSDKLEQALQVLSKYTEKKHFITDVFVMYGHRDDLSEVNVSRWALYHCQDNTLEKFVVKRFDYEVLNKLHSFVPRFQEAIKLGKIADDGDKTPDPKLKFIGKSVMDYHNYSKETEKLLEQMVLDL
ncbi:hypothetical protein UFOVP1290_220 [uncultured Caudovirales phage]|uniref:Uncharacterized protein n=1 Tax=uncultured Caudovirales phage TaxID=2100421 RepID=A0A6J5RGL8_9CAUD|nr:hypothetical protein UFOVP1290_220 [uncultured Caudovirales phage]